MIIKGKARTNGGQLAAYLADYLTAEKNERVEVLQIRGSSFPDMHRSFCSWEAEAKKGRCEKPLWHAQISPDPKEFMTREQHLEAVNILERHLCLTGQPRAVVFHKNDKGREHIHVVWSRIRREEQLAPDTRGKIRRMKVGSAISDKASKHRNCEAAREIEERFGLRKIATPKFANQDKTKTRKERREQSKAAPNQRDFNQAKRSGIDPREVARDVRECWQMADSGKAFRTALFERDYILCLGDRRDYVVVDRSGTIHSASRRAGVKLDDMRERLKDLDPASIPKAVHIEAQLKAAWREKLDIPPRKYKPVPAPSQQSSAPTQATAEEIREKRNPLDPADILQTLTQNQSTFTKQDLDREVAKRLERAGTEPTKDEVKALSAKVRHHSDFIVLGKDRVKRPRFTSTDMLETELHMRQLSDQLVTQQIHGVTAQRKAVVPTVSLYTDEQKAGFEYCLSEKGLIAIEGGAGTGKSFLMKGVREAYEAQGNRLRGCAVSSMAAAGLQEGSGIESRTLASTLYRLRNAEKQDELVHHLTDQIDILNARPDYVKKMCAKLQAQRDRARAWANASKLTSRDVIVLDEAGMVGSRQLTELMTHVQKAGAKLILVGDAEQLQAIDAGGAFRAITERHGSFRIAEFRRQNQDWQKQATKDFFEGFTDEALQAYKAKGHVHQIDTHAEARKQVAAAWSHARQEAPDKTYLMMAYTRHDVHELNMAARAAYRAEGKLAELDHTIETARGKRQFAEGDRLYFLKNDLGLNVMNGSLGTIERIMQPVRGPDQPFNLTIRLDNGRKVSFSTAEYNNFSHGYAATVHKAQGATVDRAFVLASQFMDRHATYVGMSRHRDQVDMYFGSDEFKNYGVLMKALARDRRKDTTLDYLDRAEKSSSPKIWQRIVEILSGTMRKQLKAEVPEQDAAKTIAPEPSPAAPEPDAKAAPPPRQKRPAEAVIDKLKIKREQAEAEQEKTDAERLERVLARFPDRRKRDSEIDFGPGT